MADGNKSKPLLNITDFGESPESFSNIQGWEVIKQVLS